MIHKASVEIEVDTEKSEVNFKLNFDPEFDPKADNNKAAVFAMRMVQLMQVDAGLTRSC